ncbi:hypothetical protein LWE61_16330 [Sphingobium sufflavum]|uniref:hypothetical protein n=1 Tax=Sphingobium sufflavum TaxID=1129547 RepID=UPI001F226230|nr:hypothetical protein [Sphingobium sufflavum]MCE7798113.1 hypothetical protein [Sphingobium sufflavum]
MQRWTTLPFFIVMLASCGTSEADYADAVKRHWFSEQAAASRDAAFYADHARSFEEGARRSAAIARELGTDNDVGKRAAEAAQGDRAKEADAAYMAKSSFESLTDRRCVSAAPRPGENCEMSISIRGPDSKMHELSAGWRFDTINGDLQVLGPIQR